jgi:glucokinase
MEIVIGIDIGGTNTKVGLINELGKSLNELSFKTQEGLNGFEDFIEVLNKNIQGLIQSREGLKIKGIGIGAPNGNFFKGTIEFAPNLKWKGILPVTESLRRKTGIDLIKLTNDANAAAIGEMVFGKANGMKDFVVMTLGTGLGSGIVTGGKLLLGHDGFAGEIGHVTVAENGRNCGCGRNGCLETYVSATGIIRTVGELFASENYISILKDTAFNELTSKQIAEEAKNGDKIALKAFEITGEYLGKALANTIAYLSPEAIILFGGLANAGDLLLNPVKKYMEKNLMAIYKDKVKLIISGLNDGANAAVLGAGALIWNEF